jgi:hypothetical protein
MKAGELARLLSVCDPESEVYIEVDLDRDVPQGLEPYERSFARFEVNGLEVYPFGVFPELRYKRGL